ncbi:hypothetical protein CYY_009683 [Polysphondylium violaceum]|uniref:Peptidase S53 domain-containing protein n=1 Tax=Polysphondylium violaceum TaxID=133409 RepID=A0A8J4UVT1_9MYCE|nr:hypothetical protein CYY_009683 [Polysphondylium violaceum]
MRQIFLLALLAICLAVPALSNVRDVSNWTKTTRANSQHVVEFRVALRQRNLDILESTFLDASNPKSVNYAKWWTIDQILDLVAPEEEKQLKVVNYLKSVGCFNVENRRDMIKASAEVEIVEKMFNVKMFNYVHNKKEQEIVRSGNDYSIPSEIKSLVHMVSGISELPHLKQGPKAQKIKLATSKNVNAVKADPGIVIPSTIQSLYGIPTGYTNNPDSSLCLAEFSDDQSFNKKDLKTFATDTATPVINVDHIVGPFSGSDPDLESTLDVQYGGAVAETASVWFWTVSGWMYDFVTDFVATSPVPYVVSMSWGWPEPLQCQSGIGNCKGETSEEYVDRVNVEFQKIGLMGVSLLAASGDQGAPGDGNPNCNEDKKPISTIFPGASPWVTSVGATMLIESSATQAVGDSAPICSKKKCATSTTEGVCTSPQALITTGGGFSDYSPMPSYQQDVVEAYLKSGAVFPKNTYFNASNRAFPDVSALGHNYYIIAGGEGQVVDGTSCSSPVFGAIVTLLNSYRLNNNKPTLGFLNPLLYQLYAENQSAYTDITTGNNYCTENCCSKVGYQATKGYDAVTGLGTPVFKEFLAYVQNLS